MTFLWFAVFQALVETEVMFLSKKAGSHLETMDTMARLRVY